MLVTERTNRRRGDPPRGCAYDFAAPCRSSRVPQRAARRPRVRHRIAVPPSACTSTRRPISRVRKRSECGLRDRGISAVPGASECRAAVSDFARPETLRMAASSASRRCRNSAIAFARWATEHFSEGSQSTRVGSASVRVATAPQRFPAVPCRRRCTNGSAQNRRSPHCGAAQADTRPSIRSSTATERVGSRIPRQQVIDCCGGAVVLLVQHVGVNAARHLRCRVSENRLGDLHAHAGLVQQRRRSVS